MMHHNDDMEDIGNSLVICVAIAVLAIGCTVFGLVAWGLYELLA